MRVVSWASSPGMKLETRRYASYSVPGRVASWEPLCALRYLRSLFFFSLHLASFSMPSSIFSSLFYFFIFWGIFWAWIKMYSFSNSLLRYDFQLNRTTQDGLLISEQKRQSRIRFRAQTAEISWISVGAMCTKSHGARTRIIFCFFLLFLNFSSGHHLYTILLYSFHLFQVDIKGE